MIAVRILLFIAGTAVILRTIRSALVTFVVPRAIADALTRWVFLRTRDVFSLLSKRARNYPELDGIWALYAPVALFMLPFVWIVLILCSYAGLYAGVGVAGWSRPFALSGSSLFTLGVSVPKGLPETALAYSEAALGLGLIALLIAYLPTIYNAWSRREALVSLLEVRAGDPPTPFELYRRYFLIGRLGDVSELWERWETWFAEVEESHTSLASLPLFRSSQPHRSWVVAAGAVLDSAALAMSSLQIPRDAEAALMLRGGTLCLRSVCALFRLPFPADPHYPGTPISVTRAEWEDVCDRLAEVGVPIVADRDQAWSDFAGWRVNYDVPLRALAGLTIAREAPWSSDRPIEYRQ